MKNLYDSFLYNQDLQIAIKDTLGISELSGKSMLITGASGLIGSYIVDMLCFWNSLQKCDTYKINIYACSRRLENLTRRFAGCREQKFLHFCEMDVSKDVYFEYPVDFIIHAASNAYPAAFNDDPVGTILANVVGTYKLLLCAHEKNVQKVLLISSGEIYGEGVENMVAFTENYSGYVDPINPRSCYPSSKRTAETLCVAFQKQFGVQTVVARPCHIYGPNTTLVDNRATVQFFNKALENEDIVMKSTGKQLRSYCYIADCASALLSILINGISGQAYNIANPTSRLTIAEFADVIAKLSGVSVLYNGLDTLLQGEKSPISKAVLSSEKLEALGWRGRFGPYSGINHTLSILQFLRK